MTDDLRDFQERIGKAVRRARMGEDATQAGKLRDTGQRAVTTLAGLLRMTRVHSLDNEAFVQPIADLRDALGTLVGSLGTAEIATVEDQVYLNGMRLRFQRRDDVAHELSRELKRHSVGGISFHAVPVEPHVREFLAQISRKPDPDSPRRALEQALVRCGLDYVQISGIFRFRLAGEKPGVPDAREVAARAVVVADETWDNLGANRLPNPLPIRRVVTEILRLGPGAEGLWDEPDGASAHAAHTLRVVLAALALGKLASLPEDQLQDLGVAAMFHDVGYAAREGAVPAKSGQPAFPGYAPPFERHPAAGVRLLLRQRGFHESKVRRALATVEHHRDYADGRGRPGLYGRILRIVEDYDNLIRLRGGGVSPAEALQRMVPHAGGYYDPVLLQLLVNALGRYPPGTRLQLKDGRVVRSISIARSPETYDKPRTAVERQADQTVPVRQIVVDLAEEGEVHEVLPPW